MYDEGDVEELDLFFDRGREPVVHRLGERRHLPLDRVVVRAADVARVDAVDTRAVAAHRERLLALPERQGAPAHVGGEQVDQVGGSRTRQPDDDQWLLDLDVADLGMYAQ